jgi:hypothetical protein
MSNINNKKNISLIILAVVSLLFIAFIYFVNNRIFNYKLSMVDDYNRLAELEKEKTILVNYKNILLAGSSESDHVKKYILTDDRKNVLGFMNELENYTKNVGLTGANDSLITSVASRESASITKYNAGDLVINMKISGNDNEIDNFLNLLNNIPLVSYIEKIDVRFDNVIKKNNVNITLIIYQKHESK